MEKGTVILDTKAENLEPADILILNASRVGGIMVGRYHETSSQKWCIKIFLDTFKFIYPLSYDFCKTVDEAGQRTHLLKLAAKLEEQLWGATRLETKLLSGNYGL